MRDVQVCEPGAEVRHQRVELGVVGQRQHRALNTASRVSTPSHSYSTGKGQQVMIPSEVQSAAAERSRSSAHLLHIKVYKIFHRSTDNHLKTV